MCWEAHFNPRQIWYHQGTLLGAQDTHPEDEDLSVPKGDGRVGRGSVLPPGPVLQQGTRGTSQDPPAQNGPLAALRLTDLRPHGKQGRTALTLQEALGQSRYLRVNPLVLDGLEFTESCKASCECRPPPGSPAAPPPLGLAWT